MAGRISKKAWLIIAIVIIAIGAIVGVALTRNPTSPSDLTLPVITWNETSLSELQGRPVVLNFWSIGCYWCRQQLPYLEAVARQSEGELKVIAINMANSAADIQKFFADYEPAMTIAVDKNREAFRDYCVAYNNTGGYIPFTLFVDSEGIVQYVKTGAFASETQVWDTLSSVFGITTP
jgi:thiol-disulfide isomerase/thioredoxin